MSKIIAKYVACASLFAAWLYTAHWAAASSYPAVKVISGLIVVSMVATALIIFFMTMDDSATELDRFDAGMWSLALLTGFVFFSRIAYESMLDWFTGPGILAFVLGIVAGGYAIWPELEKDFAMIKHAKFAKVFNLSSYRNRKG